MPPTTSPRVCTCRSNVPRRCRSTTRRSLAAATRRGSDPGALRAARRPSARTARCGRFRRWRRSRTRRSRAASPPSSRVAATTRSPRFPYTARRRRRSSAAAPVFVFPTMAHGSVWQNWVDECPASIAQQFLRDPAAEPDSSCIDAMEPHRLPHHERHLPDDRHLPVQQRCRSRIATRADRHRIASLSLILIGTLGVRDRLRRLVADPSTRRSAPAGAVLAAATASGFFVAFAGALAVVVLNTDPLILAFGIPPAAASARHRAAHRDRRRRFCWRSWSFARGSAATARLVPPGGALDLGRGVASASSIWLIVRGLLIF